MGAYTLWVVGGEGNLGGNGRLELDEGQLQALQDEETEQRPGPRKSDIKHSFPAMCDTAELNAKDSRIALNV